MTEENTVVEEKPAEVTPAEVTPAEVKPGDDVISEELKAEEEKARKNRISGKNRVNMITREKYEALRQVEELRKENEALKSATKIAKRPNEDDYDDHDAYLKDRAAYNTQRENEIRQDERNKVKEESKRRKMYQERKKVSEKWQSKKVKAIKKYENFVKSEQEVLDVIQDFEAVEIQECILESKIGDAIVDYLGTHISETQEIAQLPPRAQARAILKLERKLESEPVKKLSSAPEPIKPLSTGGANVNKSVIDMSPAEYRKWAKERGM